MNILLITDILPYPPISGDRIRTYQLAKQIAKHHDLTLAGFVEESTEIDCVTPLEAFCKRVLPIPEKRKHPVHHLPGLLRYALSGKPPELKFKYSSDLVRQVRESMRHERFDLVQVEHSTLALYRAALDCGAQTRWILVFQNITYQQYGRLARVQVGVSFRMRARLNAWWMRHWEPRYAARYDQCVVVSDADRQELLRANPALRIGVIPNGVDTRQHQLLAPSDRPPALLFVGTMSYGACADAAQYFCHEILPRIQALNGPVQTWIIGSNPPLAVRKLDGGDVHVTGFVPDVVRYYAQSHVCVVPLRAGGGTRLKILEAMALGRPVVSTTIGAEGLDTIPGRHLLLADSPDSFAREVCRLLADADLRQRIVEQARSFVVEHHDWDVIGLRLNRLYTEILTAQNHLH